MRKGPLVTLFLILPILFVSLAGQSSGLVVHQDLSGDVYRIWDADYGAGDFGADYYAVGNHSRNVDVVDVRFLSTLSGGLWNSTVNLSLASEFDTTELGQSGLELHIFIWLNGSTEDCLSYLFLGENFTMPCLHVAVIDLDFFSLFEDRHALASEGLEELSISGGLWVDGEQTLDTGSLYGNLAATVTAKNLSIRLSVPDAYHGGWTESVDAKVTFALIKVLVIQTYPTRAAEPDYTDFDLVFDIDLDDWTENRTIFREAIGNGTEVLPEALPGNGGKGLRPLGITLVAGISIGMLVVVAYRYVKTRATKQKRAGRWGLLGGRKR